MNKVIDLTQAIKQAKESGLKQVAVWLKRAEQGKELTSAAKKFLVRDCANGVCIH